MKSRKQPGDHGVQSRREELSFEATKKLDYQLQAGNEHPVISMFPSVKRGWARRAPVRRKPFLAKPAPFLTEENAASMPRAKDDRQRRSTGLGFNGGAPRVLTR